MSREVIDTCPQTDREGERCDSDDARQRQDLDSEETSHALDASTPFPASTGAADPVRPDLGYGDGRDMEERDRLMLDRFFARAAWAGERGVTRARLALACIVLLSIRLWRRPAGESASLHCVDPTSDV